MSLSLSRSLKAVAPNITSSFLAAGGAEPYVYSVLPGGAGGSIDPDSGLYTAPAQMGSTPQTMLDTVQVTDDNGDTATATILVGTPLFLLCDIIQTFMGLSDGRVYVWDQKINQPSDSSLYVAVSMPWCKPFANNVAPDPSTGWADAVQTVNMLAQVDIDIISRGPAARDQKELVVMALQSIYAQQQQEANSFYIGKIPPSGKFLNLSMIDGAAIPYRYKISVQMQYVVTKTATVPYIDTFEVPQITTNP